MPKDAQLVLPPEAPPSNETVPSDLKIINDILLDIASAVRGQRVAPSHEALLSLPEQVRLMRKTLRDIAPDIQNKLYMTRAFAKLWWVGLLLLGIIFVGPLSAILSASGKPWERAGALVIVLGIVVATWPYWREGFSRTAERLLPHAGAYLVSGAAAHEARREAAPGIAADVAAERYVGIALIILGTLLTGFSG